MGPKALLLLVLITLATLSNARIPVGQEKIYNYHARIRVGTYKPATFASQFMMDGKLHLQKVDANTIMMRFTDLTYKLFNGELNHRDEYESLPLKIPDQAADLMKPFRIVYNAEGQIDYMMMEKEDRRFSRNMKQALASIFQMDLKHVKLDTKTPYAFTTTEDSIYGPGTVRYNIMPEEKEVIVEKMLDVESARNWMAYFGVTDENRNEDFMNRTSMSVNSNRQYNIVRDKEGVHHIRHIQAVGGIYLHLLKGFSDSQFMSVNQTMDLLQTIPIKDKIAMTSEERVTGLAFKMEVDPDRKTLADLSLGRSEMTMDMYKKLIMEKLKFVVEYLELNHLPREKPDLEKGQAVNTLRRMMAMLDMITMEQLFTTLEKETDEMHKKMFIIFQEMLPLIGTKASTMFIHTLVKTKKVNDEMAMSMMRKMPFNLRMACEKMLMEMEDMINMENVDMRVKKVALLTFASLVHKVFEHDMTFERDQVLHKERDATKREAALEKYIIMIMDLLKGAQDYPTQFMYMNALFNIKIGNVYKYMEPYITGEATKNKNLRFFAMQVSFSEALKHPEWVYKVYWPIFTDRTLDLELRAAAYTIIIDTMPSMATLWDIYWFMTSEPCPELYHLHYTTLRSAMYTTEHTMQDFRIRATQILNYMRKPFMHPLTGLYVMDYEDPKFGFGAMSNLLLLSTNTTKMMYIDLSTHAWSMPVRDYAFWIRIDGIDSALMKHLPNPKDMTDMFWIEQLFRMLMTIKDQKNLHVEYAILKHEQIIQMGILDHTNIKDFHVNWMNLLFGDHLRISYEFMTQLLMPNDMGLPTVMQLLVPTIIHRKLSLTDEKTDGTTVHDMDMKFQRVAHSIKELNFYNPIPDIWQGISRVQALDMITDLDFKLSSSKPMNFKLTMNRHEDDSRDKFTWRNYATTVTTIYGDTQNILEKSCKKSKHHAVVSTGEDYRIKKTLFEHDCMHTGLRMEIATFDTKERVSRDTLMRWFRMVSDKYFKNYQTMPNGRMMLTMLHAMNYIMIHPDFGTFGFIVRITPSKIYPTDHVDFAFRFNNEITTDAETNLPLTKYSSRATLSTKTKDNKLIRMFDTNAILNMNLARTINNLKMQFSMITPENDKEFKICIDGKNKWMDTKVSGNMDIKMGYSADPKMCTDTDGLIEITMRGGQSDEQLRMMEKRMTYDECLPMNKMYEPLMKNMHIHYANNVDCLKKLTSIRKFEYDVKSTKISEDMMKRMRKMRRFIKGMLFPYVSMEEMENQIDENSMKVLLEYPTMGEEMNWHIMTKRMNINVTEAPRRWFSMFGIHPRSYHFTESAIDLYNLGMTESCLVDAESILNNNHEIIRILDHEWMQVVHRDDTMTTDPMMEIFVKKVEGRKDMALRMKLGDQMLEIIPSGEEYTITLNGKPLTMTKGSYHVEGLFSIGMLNDRHHTIVMHVFKIPLYIDYDGETMRMDKLKLDMRLTGLCFTD